METTEDPKGNEQNSISNNVEATLETGRAISDAGTFLSEETTESFLESIGAAAEAVTEVAGGVANGVGKVIGAVIEGLN